MANNIVTLSSATFQETVSGSSTPVLVDFWAEWCGPCKAIAPILEELALEKAGQLTIAKLNVDDHGDIAGQYGVMSIPTLILFDKGEVKHRMVGAKPKAALVQELAGFLPSSH